VETVSADAFGPRFLRYAARVRKVILKGDPNGTHHFQRQLDSCFVDSSIFTFWAANIHVFTSYEELWIGSSIPRMAEWITGFLNPRTPLRALTLVPWKESEVWDDPIRSLLLDTCASLHDLCIFSRPFSRQGYDAWDRLVRDMLMNLHQIIVLDVIRMAIDCRQVLHLATLPCLEELYLEEVKNVPAGAVDLPRNAFSRLRKLNMREASSSMALSIALLGSVRAELEYCRLYLHVLDPEVFITAVQQMGTRNALTWLDITAPTLALTLEHSTALFTAPQAFAHLTHLFLAFAALAMSGPTFQRLLHACPNLESLALAPMCTVPFDAFLGALRYTPRLHTTSGVLCSDVEMPLSPVSAHAFGPMLDVWSEDSEAQAAVVRRLLPRVQLLCVWSMLSFEGVVPLTSFVTTTYDIATYNGDGKLNRVPNKTTPVRDRYFGDKTRGRGQ
jgi:hypothetical protein